MEREALKLALEALELNNDEWKSLADSGDAGFWNAEDQDHYRQTNDAISAIKEALAQPAQEPVAWVTGVYGGRFTYEPINPAMVLPIGMALYAAPKGNT